MGMGVPMKKIIAALLVLGLVFSPLPSAFAEEPEVAQEGNEATQEEETVSEEVQPPEEQATSEITDEEISEVLENTPLEEDQNSISPLSTLLASDEKVTTLAGKTQYDTAAQEALFSFASSSTAIIVSGEQSVDGLAAVSLAGALDCPILLTARTTLPQATSEALQTLGVTQIIIIGGNGVISAEVGTVLGSGRTVTRIFGKTQYDTQLEIFRYGEARSLWGSTFFVATGVQGNFADTLSIGPVAYKLKAPIFFTDESGGFPQTTAQALLAECSFSQAYAIGGKAVVSEEALGFLEFVTLANGGARKVTRISGSTLYDTSAAVAQWATSTGVLAWNYAAFSTGLQPYDALAGSVVQGRTGSVLLLVDTDRYAVLDTARNAGAAISHIRFFGGTGAIGHQTRTVICAAFGIQYISTAYDAFNISLSRFADIQVAASARYQAYNKSQILESMDPANTPFGSTSFYQFAVLTDGYSGITAQQLNAYIDGMVVYQERNYGVTSKLRGTGAYFVAASQTYGINEVYLLSHAALESAWGCSPLAQGSVGGYIGYLNFYGIGAYDIDPNNGGAALAKQQGWNTPQKAIMGAAQWISNNYLKPTIASGSISGPQNTLWLMRWDVRCAVYNGTVGHQYATGRTWATSTARVMSDAYSAMGRTVETCGLRFSVPRFA